MFNYALKDRLVRRVLPTVQNPMSYAGGEPNVVRKDHRAVRGTVTVMCVCKDEAQCHRRLLRGLIEARMRQPA